MANIVKRFPPSPTPPQARAHVDGDAMKLCTQLKAGIKREIGQLYKTQALLIATQFAANHDCEFDVPSALAAIVERVEQTLAGFDQLEAAEAMEQPKEARDGRR